MYGKKSTENGETEPGYAVVDRARKKERKKESRELRLAREERLREKEEGRRRRGKPHRERTKEEVPVTNCGLIVREIAPAACCALLLLLSVLHVVSSTSSQPLPVLKILILSGNRADLAPLDPRRDPYCYRRGKFLRSIDLNYCQN